LLIVMLWLDIWTELNKGLFSEWDLTMAPMRQLMVSTLGIWTLQTHLALDKSILTMLIIHGIGNLVTDWSRTYQGDFTRLYSFYQRTIASALGGD